MLNVFFQFLGNFFSKFFPNSRSSLLDITICFLIVPYVIFPIPGGIPLGFLSFLGVPPGYQASILIICASYTAISIINFYKNRHHSMKHGPNSQNLKTRLCRYVYIAANCVAAVAFLVPIYILHPGQRDIQKYTIEVSFKNFGLKMARPRPHNGYTKIAQ